MPNANPTLAYPMQNIFHLLMFGLALGIIGSCGALLTGVGHYWLALGGRVGRFGYQHMENALLLILKLWKTRMGL